MIQSDKKENTPSWKCKGCGAGWTFQGTGYCGPCLELMDQVPEPLTLSQLEVALQNLK
jgi:hypothetical protein